MAFHVSVMRVKAFLMAPPKSFAETIAFSLKQTYNVTTHKTQKSARGLKVTCCLPQSDRWI